MTLTVDIDFKSSFKKKTNHAAVKKAESIAIKKTTLKAENGCKHQCPVDTGALMRGHSHHITQEEGQVRNRMNYAVYVIHGTSKMKANNYPARVMNELSSQKYASNIFKQELKRQGVTE